MTIVHGGVGWG